MEGRTKRENIKSMLTFVFIIFSLMVMLFVNYIPESIRGIASIVVILGLWGVTIYNVYDGVKKKEYNTYILIAVCQIVLVAILSVWAYKIIVDAGSAANNTWIMAVVLCLVIVEKRLSDPKNRVKTEDMAEMESAMDSMEKSSKDNNTAKSHAKGEA